jgi:hypothetical protein
MTVKERIEELNKNIQDYDYEKDFDRGNLTKYDLPIRLEKLRDYFIEKVNHHAPLSQVVKENCTLFLNEGIEKLHNCHYNSTLPERLYALNFAKKSAQDATRVFFNTIFYIDEKTILIKEEI